LSLLKFYLYQPKKGAPLSEPVSYVTGVDGLQVTL
jgi:hypothetical protein